MKLHQRLRVEKYSTGRIPEEKKNEQKERSMSGRGMVQESCLINYIMQIISKCILLFFRLLSLSVSQIECLR